MKKIKWSYLGSIILTIAAFLVGATSGVCMAEATIGDLPDAGKTVNAAASITVGMEANEGLYMSDIDQRITRIRPMATPIDQISRHSKALKSESMMIEYYSVGTRPIKTILSAAVVEQTTVDTKVALSVEDPTMFDEADTIRILGVKGYINGDKTKPSNEDLVLCVVGKNDNGKPTVCAVNGFYPNGSKVMLIPAIAAGKTLIRMGKACAELDAQTSVFSNIPTAEIQYCQNFMMQVEQSTLDKMAKKEVDWRFSDLEEDGVYDMRLGQENTFLFGSLGKMKHPTKNNTVWFTEGIWWQAGKDIEVGFRAAAEKDAVITDSNLVNLTKDLFTGTGVGNKRKILFAGSEMLAAFSKIESDKFRLKESVEVWSLKFKSFDTDFGEVLVMHHELFDMNGMADCGLVIDPEYLTKKSYLAWERNVLDLQAAGIRKTDAVVLQEICCLYLRYKKAHARLKLAEYKAA